MVTENRALHSSSVTLDDKGVARTMMGLMFACEPHTIGYQLIANLRRSPNLSISAATVNTHQEHAAISALVPDTNSSAMCGLSLAS